MQIRSRRQRLSSWVRCSGTDNTEASAMKITISSANSRWFRHYQFQWSRLGACLKIRRWHKKGPPKCIDPEGLRKRRTGTWELGRHKKGEEEEGKQEREGRDRRLRGRARGRKEPKVPFSPNLFMDASKAYMRVAHERNSSWNDRNSSWNEATKQAVYDYVYCIVVFFP